MKQSNPKKAKEIADKKVSALFKGQWPTTRQVSAYLKHYYQEAIKK